MKKYSDKFTFKANIKCPTGFDSWTFFWSYPEIDNDANLEYLVLKPNGKKYSHWQTRDYMNKNPQKGSAFRSDFGTNFEGGNPKCFYDNKLEITFMVNKGIINFDPKNVKDFKFQFHKTVNGALRKTMISK